MSPLPHVIGRQVLDLTLDSVDDAFALQEEVRVAFDTHVLPAVEDLLDRHAGSDVVIRIDTLEIDVGRLTPAELGEVFAERVSEVLEAELASRGTPSTPGGGDGLDSVVSREHHTLLLWQHVLEYGALPWWGPPGASAGLDERVADVLGEMGAVPDELARLLRAKPVVVERLATQAPDRLWTTLLELVDAPWARIAEAELQELEELLVAPPHVVGPRESVLGARRAAALTEAVQTSSAPIESRLQSAARRTLETLTRAGGPTYREILAAIQSSEPRVASRSVRPLLGSVLSELASAEGLPPSEGPGVRSAHDSELGDSAHESELGDGAAAVSVGSSGDVAAGTPAHEERKEGRKGAPSAETQPLPGSGPSATGESTRKVASSVGVGGPEKPDGSDRAAGQSMEGVPAPGPIVDDTLGADPGGVASGLAESDMTSGRDGPLPPADPAIADGAAGTTDPTSSTDSSSAAPQGAEESIPGSSDSRTNAPAARLGDADPDALLGLAPDRSPPLELEASLPTGSRVHDVAQQGGGYFVDDAGMVLLSPFLGTHFERLGLLHGGGFVDDHARARAVHQLRFLATGEDVSPEYVFVMAKLLCGVPIHEPIHASTSIDDDARAEGETLLTAVIEHWGALKKSSPDGLREGFLERDGHLELLDDGWRLRVETRPIDVLLGRLPWTHSMIRLPWMTRMVRVEWAG